MGGKAPAFQLYAADFYMDTADWTCPQVGVYMRLLMYEWINGGLSPQISDLARIAKVDCRTMHKMWSTKLAKKFQLNGTNLLINKRLEEEREKQNKRRELQVEKGISGAKKRWEGYVAPAIAQVKPVPIPNDSSSSSSSSSIKKKEIIKKEKLSDDKFLQQLKETYTWVDYEFEIKKIDLWLTNNPQRKKTRKFILNWFGRKEKPLSINQPSKTQIEGGRAIKNSYDCHNCHKNFTEYTNYLTHKCKPLELMEARE